jgi:uncharacterized membrane protein
MKNPNVLIALIIAVALVASAVIISHGVTTFGESVERAASSIGSGIASRGPVSIPSSIRLDLAEIKIANGGGGGESFRIQTTGK